MKKSAYKTRLYWKKRSKLMYYRYIQRIVEKLGAEAKSMIDVGSGNCPYLEWFDWIPERVSVDIGVPYSSDHVRGITGDIFQLEFPKRFDLCTCLQVLEHVPDAAAFGRRCSRRLREAHEVDGARSRLPDCRGRTSVGIPQATASHCSL